MDELVHDAHRILDEEVNRLGVVYRRSIEDAQHIYQQGLMEAQLQFEARLNAAMAAMTDAVHAAMKQQ